MQEEKAQCFGKERSVVPDGPALNFSLNSGDDAPILMYGQIPYIIFTCETRR